MKRHLAFWSYARLDDQDEKLSWLYGRLQDELHAQSGHRHEIFQDRHDLKIGNDWDNKLDEGLRAAEFLIPIITPRFFESEPCREEVNAFLKREEAEGTPDLILPIYWITSPRINDRAIQSTDRLARQITKHQWGDWREYRHLPRNNPKWDQLITQLATEILARYKENTFRGLNRANISGKIHWPTTGQRVFREITVKGTVSGLPEHYQLWVVVVLAGGGVHPQSKITPDPSGKWSGKARIGSGGVNSSTGAEFRLQFLAVTAETSEAFTRYLIDAGLVRQWPGIEPQEGSRQIDEIRVIRDDAAGAELG
jgi:hypothetical protein